MPGPAALHLHIQILHAPTLRLREAADTRGGPLEDPSLSFGEPRERARQVRPTEQDWGALGDVSQPERVVADCLLASRFNV